MGQAGDDRLEGEHGADRLLGNAGADLVLGQAGDDHLEGGYGRDILRGGVDDDRLDGGPGRDACLQASGSGRLTRCENAYADLAIVTLSCPSAVTLDVPFECQVKLTNHGPEPAHYVLGSQPPPKCDTGSCGVWVWSHWTFHTVHHPDAGAQLAAGDERTDVIEVVVVQWPGSASNVPEIRIRLRPIDELDAIDPEAGNDRASTPIARA